MTESSSVPARRGCSNAGWGRAERHRLQPRAAPPRPGQILLGLSALGSPLTQLAIRRLGRRGAVVVESVCAGLFVRDAMLIALGTPRRLRRGPAALLWLELGAALTATILCVPLLTDPDALARAREPRARGVEAARRGAVSALFGLHTLRYRIYLQPDRGLRESDHSGRAAQGA